MYTYVVYARVSAEVRRRKWKTKGYERKSNRALYGPTIIITGMIILNVQYRLLRGIFRLFLAYIS